MEKIIIKIYKLIKERDDLIILEEPIKHLINGTFTELVNEIFTELNQPIKEKHSVVRDDPCTIHVSFDVVTYYCTLVKNNTLNKSINLLDKWLGICESIRYSHLNEVKADELGSKNGYREAARILSGWTHLLL